MVLLLDVVNDLYMVVTVSFVSKNALTLLYLSLPSGPTECQKNEHIFRFEENLPVI